MKIHTRFLASIAMACALGVQAHAAPLDLTGYVDEHGVISVQHKGATADPYFSLQALLLAQEHGLDTSRYAQRWADWLIPKQKPDGTFDRFCRTGNTWAPCKTADADDSLLVLWMRFLESHPAELKRNPAWRKSHEAAQASLKRLEDKGRGIYMVSPVYLHGLFMDNLEVWSWKPSHAGVQTREKPDFGRSIQEVFWDPAAKRFHVSTQLEQRTAEPAFYPDAVAQIFPLTVGYPHIPGGAKSWYQQWMRQHRAEWLQQVKKDFAWGLIATVALKQGDTVSARCWLRTALPARHSSHWTATDEVTAQILTARGLKPADAKENCQ
jgi:hypothetical protein